MKAVRPSWIIMQQQPDHLPVIIEDDPDFSGVKS